MIRTITTFRQPGRWGLAMLFNPTTRIWRIVPSSHNGIGTHYHWDAALPGEYRTKKECAAARKGLNAWDYRP